MGDLAHARHHQQTNGSLAVAPLSCIPGIHRWCFARLASARGQQQDKEGIFNPIWRLRVAISHVGSAVQQLHHHRPSKMFRTVRHS